MLFSNTVAILSTLPLLSLAGIPIIRNPHPPNVHGKRSFYVDPTGNGVAKPWPDGHVDWCLEADAIDQEFMGLMDGMWIKWVNAFGGSTRSKVMISFAGLCKYDEGGNFLHIFLTNEQRAATTLGFSSAGFTNGQPNQLMRFDKSNTWGTGDSTANLAHEFGHAFGLLHEHQKWYPWHEDLLANPPRSDPLLKFNCENLADYQQFNDAGNNMDDLCSNQFSANQAGFSAVEFLPWPQFTLNQQSPDFDWNSIMMYSSTSGAKTELGVKQNTMTKFDGTIINPNLDPSGRDGEAVRNLYPPA
jgi:hypothetical protein